MARRTNSTVRAVRFYEEEGLIRPAPRTCGEHRFFCDGELQRLELITRLRGAGLSLSDIKLLLAAKSGCADASSDATEAARKLRSMLESQIDGIESKLKCLTQLRDDLVDARDRLADCANCEDVQFPRNCQGCKCGVEVSKAFRVLWS